MKNFLSSTYMKLRKEYDSNRTLFVLRATVLALVVALLITKRTFWTPDTMFVILLGVFVVFGQARGFLIRFLPLISLMLLYEVFRGWADDLNGTVHFMEMIDFDRWMFLGDLPTVVLQQWWWHGSLQWYDFYFYFLYTIHFLMPLGLAVWLWKKAESYYWPFAWAIVGLSFAAFITYIVFPAAPPWMAKELGYIAEPLHRISSDIWAAMGIQNFSEIYANLPANPVAAVPSLHSAYPMLFSLFIVSIYGFKKYWWVFLYPISMWIGVVYMGEHYVIDAILGAGYATLAFYISHRYFKWYRHPHRKFRESFQSFIARIRLAA